MTDLFPAAPPRPRRRLPAAAVGVVVALVVAAVSVWLLPAGPDPTPDPTAAPTADMSASETQEPDPSPTSAASAPDPYVALDPFTDPVDPTDPDGAQQVVDAFTDRLRTALSDPAAAAGSLEVLFAPACGCDWLVTDAAPTRSSSASATGSVLAATPDGFAAQVTVTFSGVPGVARGQLVRSWTVTFARSVDGTWQATDVQVPM